MSKLSTLIAKKKWDEVEERIQSHPDELHSSDTDYLPLHRACWQENIPIKVIEALIQAHPQSVQQPTKSYGRLPLHFAVTRYFSPNTKVIQLLLQNYPQGASVKDVCGQTPLQYHLCKSPSPSLQIVIMLVEADPNQVHKGDQHQWYPLHYAAYRSDWPLIRYLIGVYPEALRTRNALGKTPGDIAKQKPYYDKLCAEETKRFGSIGVASPPSFDGIRLTDSDIASPPSIGGIRRTDSDIASPPSLERIRLDSDICYE